MNNPRTKSIFTQIGLQAFLLTVTLTVLFPIMWVFSIALDPRNIDKPLELNLIPPGATFESFRKVLFDPFQLLCTSPNDPDTCMRFSGLLMNSLLVSFGTSLIVVVLGASAAYAFSRFRFIGREIRPDWVRSTADAAGYRDHCSIVCAAQPNKNWG